MAVSATLKAALLAAYNQQIPNTTDQPGPVTELSDAQAQAIVAAVVEAINTTTVSFVLTAPNGPVTGVITLQAIAS